MNEDDSGCIVDVHMNVDGYGQMTMNIVVCNGLI
jgi:hypothetical protein